MVMTPLPPLPFPGDSIPLNERGNVVSEVKMTPGMVVDLTDTYTKSKWEACTRQFHKLFQVPDLSLNERTALFFDWLAVHTAHFQRVKDQASRALQIESLFSPGTVFLV